MSLKVGMEIVGLLGILLSADIREGLCAFMQTQRGLGGAYTRWPALACARYPQGTTTSVRFSTRQPLWKARRRTRD